MKILSYFVEFVAKKYRDSYDCVGDINGYRFYLKQTPFRGRVCRSFTWERETRRPWQITTHFAIIFLLEGVQNV